MQAVLLSPVLQRSVVLSLAPQQSVVLSLVHPQSALLSPVHPQLALLSPAHLQPALLFPVHLQPALLSPDILSAAVNIQDKQVHLSTAAVSYTHLMALLNQESKLMEIVKLIGGDVLPDDQKLTLEIARVIRLGFLQQNAFHQEDTCAVSYTHLVTIVNS